MQEEGYALAFLLHQGGCCGGAGSRINDRLRKPAYRGSALVLVADGSGC